MDALDSTEKIQRLEQMWGVGRKNIDEAMRHFKQTASVLKGRGSWKPGNLKT